MLFLKRFSCLAFFMLALVTSSSNAFATSSTIIVRQEVIKPSPALSQQDKFRLELMKKYASLSLADYENLKGKKLGFLERTYFKMNQYRIRKFIQHYDGDGPNVLSKISWFCKGLLLGPIAVLLAYILFKDEERELIKWTWFGFGTLLLVIATYFLFFANK